MLHAHLTIFAVRAYQPHVLIFQLLLLHLIVRSPVLTALVC